MYAGGPAPVNVNWRYARRGISVAAGACSAPAWRLNPWAYLLTRWPMRAILDVILLILNLYTWVLIISAVLSWLLAFNVINYDNNFVRTVWNGLNALTEPLLRPIRRRLPQMGAIDLSPIILLVAIFFLERVIVYYIYPTAERF